MNALGVLAQHLVVLLDPTTMSRRCTMHTPASISPRAPTASSWPGRRRQQTSRCDHSRSAGRADTDRPVPCAGLRRPRQPERLSGITLGVVDGESVQRFGATREHYSLRARSPRCRPARRHDLGSSTKLGFVASELRLDRVVEAKGEGHLVYYGDLADREQSRWSPRFETRPNTEGRPPATAELDVHADPGQLRDAQDTAHSALARASSAGSRPSPKGRSGARPSQRPRTRSHHPQLPTAQLEDRSRVGRRCVAIESAVGMAPIVKATRRVNCSVVSAVAAGSSGWGTVRAYKPRIAWAA